MPGYDVGVDAGTTYTAAAVWRDGRARMVPLGTRAAEVPSVVYLTPGGEWLVGQPAEVRGSLDPDRLGREFKRRMGDQTPILLGGTPQSAAALTGRLLAWLLARVAAPEGGPPDHLILTCPANWGGYKRDVLREAIDIAAAEAAGGTWPPGEVTVVSEPLATATHFAASAQLGPDEVVAVYDLGGGTFDAAVMAQRGDGHRLLGDAIGLEHLGGIDFDDAVLGHVTAQIADQMADLDPDDPATVAALAALRRACVEARSRCRPRPTCRSPWRCRSSAPTSGSRGPSSRPSSAPPSPRPSPPCAAPCARRGSTPATSPRSSSPAARPASPSWPRC